MKNNNEKLILWGGLCVSVMISIILFTVSLQYHLKNTLRVKRPHHFSNMKVDFIEGQNSMGFDNYIESIRNEIGNFKNQYNDLKVEKPRTSKADILNSVSQFSDSIDEKHVPSNKIED